MKRWTIACLAGTALLAACSGDSSGAANGSGAAAGGPPGGYGGPGGPGGPGAYGSNGLNPSTATPGTEEDLVQAAGDRIFFETDQSGVDQNAQPVLDRQSTWLQQYPQVNVWVAGNCDERGTEEYNLALGQRRASADRDYLVAHGIDRSRIETISYGKSRPIDPGSSPDSWAHDRNAITSVK